MAQVKWNMASGIALTNAITGETIFIPCEGLEVSNEAFESLLNDPESVPSLEVRFKWDENNESIRAYLVIPS